MDLNPMDSVGTRVASLRQRAELSQDEFAQAAQVSAGMLRAAERGDIPAGASFTAAAATALSVDITVLTGQPDDELVLAPRSDRDLVSDPRSEAAGVPALRQVLSEHDNPAPVAELMSLGELRTRLDTATRLHFRARYAELSRRLPELLRHLYVHWADFPRGEQDRERLAILLDDAYALTASTIYRFGFLDLAELVDARRPLPLRPLATRCEWSARRSVRPGSRSTAATTVAAPVG